MTGFLGLPATQVVGNPLILNLYWDTSREQWNQDVSNAGRTDTFERLDALTQAAVHSNYFSQLSQYGVLVSPNAVAPSVFVGEICGELGVPPANTQIGHDTLTQIMSCVEAELGIDTSNLVVNVLYPPQVAKGSDIDCNNTAAYHDWAGWSGATTYIPLVCNPFGDQGVIFQNMTHEMVEAMTDPQTPFGYRCYEASCGSDNEMCDVCEVNDRSSPFLMGQIANDGAVANYWANNFGSCNPLPGGVPPVIPPSSVSVCGTGPNMGFMFANPVSMPWDLGGCPFWDTVPPVGQGSSMSCQGSSTMYLSAMVQPVGSSASVNVGALLRAPVADSVSFPNVSFTEGCLPDPRDPQSLDCTSNAIVSGFTADLGITPGAVITFTMTDPWSGLSTNIPVVAPSATNATLEVVPPLGSPVSGWIFFGDSTVVQGQIFGNCNFNPPGLDVQAGAVAGRGRQRRHRRRRRDPGSLSAPHALHDAPHRRLRPLRHPPGHRHGRGAGDHPHLDPGDPHGGRAPGGDETSSEPVGGASPGSARRCSSREPASPRTATDRGRR